MYIILILPRLPEALLHCQFPTAVNTVTDSEGLLGLGLGFSLCKYVRARRGLLSYSLFGNCSRICVIRFLSSLPFIAVGVMSSTLITEHVL